MDKIPTLFGIGYLGRAPGTLGSLMAALVAWPMLNVAGGWMVMALAIAAVTWLGIITSENYMRSLSTEHDPKQIIIDEVAGQWLTYTTWHCWLLAMAVTGEIGAHLLHDIAGEPVWLAAGFVLFRLFDIAKPWPISLADRKVKGGFGVMLDDLLAGVAAGTCLYLLYFFWPLITGDLMETAV